MRIFFLLLVLGRTQQKNRFDPPSPALTHPQPFRSVSPRYARLHSTEWLGMNLQKEVCTPGSGAKLPSRTVEVVSKFALVTAENRLVMT
jgi:hypothetical protein